GSVFVAAAIAHVGREEADTIVPPIIPELLVEQDFVVDEGVHWHQLDGSDPELGQMSDDGRVSYALISSAQVTRQLGMGEGEALYVCFVNDGAVPARLWRSIVAPIEAGIDHDAERRADAILLSRLEILLLRAELISEQPLSVVFDSGNGARVGIE